MCEESACLVPPLSEQQNNGATEPRVSGAAIVAGSPVNGTGGGLGAGQALVGFHEDALSQAAVGRAQLLLAIVLGLALAADCSELLVLGFVLPAAELQLCIGAHRKHWLGSISLLALVIGSTAWGVLGDRLGRRRALVSALSVAALFSAVAAVMPTYGTFMTARFCSGVGIAGAVPLAFSYLSETCPRGTRARYTGLLHSFWPLGGLYTATLAHISMPSDGEQTVLDNREHWSSWHRLMLLNILPCIACIVGLVWASESPRYLLEASREVEALQVYQRFHRLNRPGRNTQYGLTELELPSRSAYQRSPVNVATSAPHKSHISHSIDTFKDAFFRISSGPYLRSTLLLGSLHILIGLCYTGISTFAPSLIKAMNELQYAQHTKHVNQGNYTDTVFADSVENVRYTNTLFHNVTFSHVVLSHVNFLNCDFYDTEFSNVKSSRTYFENSTIQDSRFIDTDLTEQHFIHCRMSNNTFLALSSECSLDFDYNIYLHDLYLETVWWTAPMILGLIFIGFLLGCCPRPVAITTLLTMCGVSAVGLFFLLDLKSVIVMEAALKTLMMCAMNSVIVATVEAYPCHLRCTAHGLLRSLYHVSALLAIPLYGSLVQAPLACPALLTIAAMLLAAIVATRLIDNSKVLL